MFIHIFCRLSRGEENKYQLEVREEMGQLENALLATKRDYELLRIEFERTIASNEQAAPIAKELKVGRERCTQSLKTLPKRMYVKESLCHPIPGLKIRKH